MAVLNIYFGHDERAEAGTTAFMRSVIAHAKRPVALSPITRNIIVGQKEGTNAFTFRRFLVPWMQDFTGFAIFVDGSDMLCLSDIGDLFHHADPWKAVQVVKHDYQTKHPIKYRGTPMEAANADYERKQWASVMLINCSHFAWRQLTPEYVAKADPLHLLQLRFIDDDRIGELPIEWNWLADEHGPNPNAKLIHFTAGIPAFPAHQDAPMADEWRASLFKAMQATG